MYVDVGFFANAMQTSTELLIGGDWNMNGLWLSHHIGNVIIPTVTHSIIFQRGRLKPPTRTGFRHVLPKPCKNPSRKTKKNSHVTCTSDFKLQRHSCVAMLRGSLGVRHAAVPALLPGRLALGVKTYREKTISVGFYPAINGLFTVIVCKFGDVQPWIMANPYQVWVSLAKDNHMWCYIWCFMASYSIYSCHFLSFLIISCVPSGNLT